MRSEPLPLLFHCSAGQDRTGFGAVLVLTAFGVSREIVIADCLATNRIWKRERALAPDTPDDIREALLGAHQPLIESALDHAVAEHGSLEALLDNSLGLNPPRLARRCATLLQ